MEWECCSVLGPGPLASRSSYKPLVPLGAMTTSNLYQDQRTLRPLRTLQVPSPSSLSGTRPYCTCFLCDVRYRPSGWYYEDAIRCAVLT
eukprot:653826-Rhodomonas_salina.2